MPPTAPAPSGWPPYGSWAPCPSRPNGSWPTVDTGPSQALVGPLAAKRAEFVTQLDDARRQLTKAAGVSAAVATILEGPQNYLVLAANNAEMRAGSGAFLEVGVATSADGSVHLGNLDPSGAHALPAGEVNVTGDLQSNWGWLHPSLDMRNLGLTPQFDVTAPLAARMWTGLNRPAGERRHGYRRGRCPAAARGHRPGRGRRSDRQRRQRRAVPPPRSVRGIEQRIRPIQANDRTRSGCWPAPSLTQLQGQSTDLTSLATAMSSAVAGRHLMLWSKNPVDQAAWVTSGVSGTLTQQLGGSSR